MDFTSATAGMIPPLWWERWLGVRLTVFGTGRAVLRANALRLVGLVETEEDASDSDESGDGAQCATAAEADRVQ